MAHGLHTHIHIRKVGYIKLSLISELKTTCGHMMPPLLHLSNICLVVWLSSNALASINIVALHQTRLVAEWVTICGRVNHIDM